MAEANLGCRVRDRRGPAGLTAAIYLARFGGIALFEQGRVRYASVSNDVTNSLWRATGRAAAAIPWKYELSPSC